MSEKFPKWLVVTLTAIIALVLDFLLIALTQSKPAPIVAPIAEEVARQNPERKVIGHSVQGRAIEAYTYRGQGLTSASGRGETLPAKYRNQGESLPKGEGLSSVSKRILFVGGIHGGYEWNSVVLAYYLMDYLQANPEAVPANVEVTVIPNANPDGVYKIIGKEGRFNLADVPKTGDQSAGRFNAHNVDLNRNFDCKWAPTGTWKNKTVSGGAKVFSEPESIALRDYIMANKPDAVVFYHSQAGGVYASACGKAILPETTKIMHTYARASGYKAVPIFDSYEVHGASEDWLASQNISAITVELTTHKDVEWEQNLLGIKALLEFYK